MEYKDVEDLSVGDAEKLLDLFVHCCKVGVELGMPAMGMSGTLLAYSKVLESNGQPLQYYVDNPRGALGRPVNEEEVEYAKAEVAAKYPNRKKGTVH